MNAYRKIAAAALAAALMSAPAGMLAAQTTPMVPRSVHAQRTGEQLRTLTMKKSMRGVSLSKAWLRQARLGGVLLNLRLHTPMGDEVTFRETLMSGDAAGMSLVMVASRQGEALTMQADQKALDALARLGIDEIVVTDTERYVRARYQVNELRAVREALGLAEAEQLCVSGEDAPVTVVNEDGVRRLVNP